jgi:hypothetical protein
MSNHLIQSIDIEGTRYCVKHGASTPKWRTVSLLFDSMELVGAEDDDAWQNIDTNTASFIGTIQFGTCCLWKATVRFTVASEEAGARGAVISINDEIVGGFGSETSSGAEVVDIEVDLYALGLMGRACGNQWVIYTEINDFYGSGMIVEIVDVTFGPPV